MTSMSTAEFHHLAPDPGNIDAQTVVAGMFSALIGSISFSGSLVAFGKLQELLPGRPPSFARPRHLQLLQNLHADWGKRHLLCGLLAMACVFGASAQSQDRQLETLIENGQSDLDAGDFGRGR